jgi:hypothetical protein
MHLSRRHVLHLAADVALWTPVVKALGLKID